MTVGDPFTDRLRRLTALGEDDVAAVDALCRDRRQMRAHATVGSQGRTTDRIYVLLDGWACSYRLLVEGRRQITALHVPGDICNLDALYLRHADHAIGTLSPCVIATIAPRALRDLMAERQPVADAVAWFAALDTAMLAERNACLGRRSAREHVAHLFCELLIRLTAVGRARGNGYTLPLTQEEIADVLGLTSVHVNRVVQGMRREGLIDYSGKELVIADWTRLRQAAGFRADYLHLDGLNGTAGEVPAIPWAEESSVRAAQVG